MKKVLILGASGMAGHVIYNYLQAYDDLYVIGTTHANYLNNNCISLNIFDTQKVEKILNELKPEIVINCVGSLIKESKISPDKTVFCNAFFPHLIVTILMKTYAPGLLTALLLNVPINTVILYTLYKQNFIRVKEIIFSTVVVGILLLVMIPFLFTLGDNLINY